MATKDTHDDKSKPNLKVLVSFRLKGAPVQKGAVIAKSDFTNKSDWQNLAHMEPARVEETDAKVGPAAKGKSGAAMPGA